MKLIKPSTKIMKIMSNVGHMPETALELIEQAGRTCYKSEGEKSDIPKFVKSIVDRGHESVIEHSALMVRIICDRGVTHEIVRHRLCAFSQESTRYVNYGGGCTFIIPPWVDIEPGKYTNAGVDYAKREKDYLWLKSMERAEWTYQELLKRGWRPEQVRSVLPNSTKTEIIVTANFREWRHIFKLRTSKAAHPQMREIMIPLLKQCQHLIPIIFDDINYKQEEK